MGNFTKADVDMYRDRAIRLQSQLSTTEAALAESRGEVAALKEELAAERLRNPLNARAVDDPDFVLPWNLEAPHEST